MAEIIRIKYEAGTAARRRADHASENAEDYVELIDEMQAEVGAAHITDLARRLGVSHVTVHKTIKRLKTLGLVKSEPHRAVALTEEGLAMAQQSRARHEVTLRFLRALGVNEDAAADAAEGIEHHVNEELLERMRAFSAAMEKNGVVTREDLSGKSVVKVRRK
ncbi:winged helix DNA-binding protein [Candidatus Sumerlaeota bacterium]|nr:winged helix DNA-binding protein [Candidatus Sumerlaeota bacterium]